MTDGCPECNDRKLIISCVERGGWVVKCNAGHELFPYPGTTIVAYDFELSPTKITYGAR